ncbi:MAG: hypothetical protein WCL44_10110 [bacterium]
MALSHDLTRPWEIWLVHHTHVDIGYTEPQDIILRKHAEFVAQALDHCTATDALPGGERFCWTCEAAWTVKAFLARYPERAAEFFRRVREGRIEVTALYLQLTDLYTQELLEYTTDYAVTLGRKQGFEVVTAMNDDVNGWAWGLPDLLARRGVRYMDTAINETRALGVRPRPSLLRWIGPGGGELLFWHSDGYMGGNQLGLDQPDPDARVVHHLRRLEEGGYPHHIVEMRVLGRAHDNAPPGLWLCDTVQRWNAAHPAGPKLRLATAREWFEAGAAQWPVPLVEHRAGWPDWWADGNGSAAAESALVRQAQADLVTLDALAGSTGQKPQVERVERARDAAAFFCEHTWGAWCSTDQPDSLTSKSQWNTKAGFAYTAAVEARSLVQDMLAVEAGKAASGGPGILVFNPSNHVRSDVVALLVADADVGLAVSAWVSAPVRAEPGPAFHLVDEGGNSVVEVSREPAIASSARRAAQRVCFVADAVPGRGFRRYRVVAGEAPARRRTVPGVEIGAGERGIEMIRDGRTGVDWFAASGEYCMGEVIYETIPGPLGREKLCGWGAVRRDAPLERRPVRFSESSARVLPYGICLSLRATKLPGSLRSLTLDVVTYDGLPRVDMSYRMEKHPNTEAEALYVAFPLAPGHGSRASGIEHPASTSGSKPTGDSAVWLDVPGAAMRPGIDQVPGTATDWHGIQHYFAFTGGQQSIVVASPDISLVQVNGINTGKWQETLPAPNGLVMSWVMNNYWFTNFPAAQGGLTWRYSIQAMPGAFDRDAAVRFAGEVRLPLVATVITGAR